MKKLFTYTLLTSSLLLLGNYSAKAEWNYWAVKNVNIGGTGGRLDPSIYRGELYTVDSATGESTLRATKILPNEGFFNGFGEGNSYIDEKTGKVYLEDLQNQTYDIYDINTDSWEDTISNTVWQDDFTFYVKKTGLFKKGNSEIKVVENGINIDGSSVLSKKTDGSVQIGTDTNDIDITAEGLNVDGNPLITKKDNGEIHIGKNSLITKSEEETLSDGRKVQPLYAKDAEGNKIPINIDGSKLLIDGVEVQAGDSTQVTTNKNNISTNTSNIKNLGEGVAGSTALTAALTALPQTSKESKLSCGVGTGAYSSRYAVGFGCASKVNERFDINAGGSYVFGGSKSYGGGTLDSQVVKAGFVFKLGELKKPTQISMKEKEKIEAKIYSLEEKNEKIISQNEYLKHKNQSIISQNKALLARLERLEKIALSEINSQDLATIKLP
tara:strand:+ start:238 stop:1557 length:1320 start_codon:yes stop_codon:yes gene_type:complete